MPTRIDTPERAMWARRSFESLARTLRIEPLPVLVFVGKNPTPDLNHVGTWTQFIPVCLKEPPASNCACSALSFGFDFLFYLYPEVTHACFIADDFIYNPRWLAQLQVLIKRHPDAKGWSVYRSSNARWHQTLRVEGDDHLVTSISGPGAITREEWNAWGIDYRSFPRRDGLTLDIAHPNDRPGERWVTGKSYIQQIGVRGRHNHVGECDTSLDFVGEDYAE